MNEVANQQFDYSVIDEKDQDFMKGLAVEINTLANQGTEIFIKIGHALQRGKDRIDHGSFHVWVEQEFKINKVRAAEYMRIASTFKGTDSVLLDKFDKTILLLLSSPSTPESARTKAIEIAESGEYLSIKAAKELIEQERDQLVDEKGRLLHQIKKMKENPQTVTVEKVPDDYEALQKRKSELVVEGLTLKAEISQIKAAHNQELKRVAGAGDALPADYADLALAKETLTRDKNALTTRLEQINAENEKLTTKIRQLKTEQDDKIAQAVNLRMRELQTEFDTKEKQLASVQARIDMLRPEMNRLEGKVGDLSTCRESAKEIRRHLLGISILLGDLFSDCQIPESAEKELLALSSEMAQGAVAFKNFLTGTRQIGEA